MNMNKVPAEDIVSCFNQCIRKIRLHDSYAKQGNHQLSEKELSGAANELFSKTLESIVNNYRIDLIQSGDLKLEHSKTLKAPGVGVYKILDLMKVYPKISKINADISAVDIDSLKTARSTQRGGNVHDAGAVASYSVVVKSIEEIRKLILSYIDKGAQLNPIKKPKTKVKTALKNAKKHNYLSDETIRVLNKDAEREVETPELPTNVAEDPIFSCFIFDASGSMGPHRQAVIDSHPALLDTLRASAKCRNDALYVIQYTFSDSSQMLNPFEKLDANKNDCVTNLSQDNYNPSGRTALYQTILTLLQDMAVSIDACENEGIAATFTIAVITDGEDTEGGVSPAEIKTVIGDLKQKGSLRKSVVLGLVGTSFSKQELENVKTTLGFDESISLDNDQKSIRRAFQMASQSSIS